MPRRRPHRRFRQCACLAPAAAILAVALAACGDNATEPGETAMRNDTMPADTMSTRGLTDNDVFRMAQGDSTWTWWKFSDAYLQRAGDSPHGDRIRVRYNTQAATQLDPLGRISTDVEFPDRSAIVKEVYSAGAPSGLLVMYKAVGDPHAGHNAWLWAEYDLDGTILHSIAENDGVCHNCHVVGLDHTRMNDTH